MKTPSPTCTTPCATAFGQAKSGLSTILLLNKFGAQHIEATAQAGDRKDRKRRLNARLKALKNFRNN